MTVREAATILGIAESTVRNQIMNGQIRATRRGRDNWITPSALERYRRDHLGQNFGRPKGARNKPREATA
jgi:excisionase family DNA binding protein